jgi:hypothetical protein
MKYVRAPVDTWVSQSLHNLAGRVRIGIEVDRKLKSKDMNFLRGYSYLTVFLRVLEDELKENVRLRSAQYNDCSLA